MPRTFVLSPLPLHILRELLQRNSSHCGCRSRR